LGRAVGIACSGDELEEEGLVLALVDGSFFAALRAFTRATRTALPDVAAAPLVPRLCEALERGPLATLRLRMRNAGAAAADNDSFLAVANSLSCAGSYARRLRDVVTNGLGDGHAAPRARWSVGRLDALASRPRLTRERVSLAEVPSLHFEITRDGPRG